MRTIGRQIFDVFAGTVFGANVAGVVGDAEDPADAGTRTVARGIGV